MPGQRVCAREVVVCLGSDAGVGDGVARLEAGKLAVLGAELSRRSRRARRGVVMTVVLARLVHSHAAGTDSGGVPAKVVLVGVVRRDSGVVGLVVERIVGGRVAARARDVLLVTQVVHGGGIRGARLLLRVADGDFGLAGSGSVVVEVLLGMAGYVRVSRGLQRTRRGTR